MPERNSSRASERVVRQLERHAAHVLVREEVVARELKVVEHALGVEEERVAAPARKKPVLAALSHLRIRARRHGRVLHDDLAVASHAGRVGASDAANRRGLRTVGVREPCAERDVGDAVTVRVDLQLVTASGERLLVVGPGGLMPTDGWTSMIRTVRAEPSGAGKAKRSV